MLLVNCRRGTVVGPLNRFVRTSVGRVSSASLSGSLEGASSGCASGIVSSAPVGTVACRMNGLSHK
jgi:hypothetical protein